MKTGVIGIGTMGMLAAELLLKAGKSVIVSDTNHDALEHADQLGAQAVTSPIEVAQQADIILMVLPGPPQIEAVVRGLLDGAGNIQNQIIIDMSTIDPQTTRRMGAMAAERSVDYLDAPILGRPSAVGKWLLPVGGEENVLARARPVLEILGRDIMHVGELGMGNTLKLLNALMYSAINAMTAEMMAISIKAGLDPALLYETIASSPASTVSVLFKEVGRKIVDRDFDPTFSVDLMCKDNGLAIHMAEQFSASPILARTIQSLNQLGQIHGYGDEDTSALVKVYEKMLDVS